MVSAAPAPVSRLSPCPCGSGKRYKDCCGALAKPTGDAAASAASPRSGYRPSGPEWNLLSASERDRLGALMEAALVHQREGRAREAERRYREVLAVAPQTHDALHMLAMARWSEGDYVAARQLIEEALPLQPEYPAIRQNLALVISAQRAQERTAQEALCEQALPRMFDLMRAPDVARAANPTNADVDDATVHLIGVDDGSDGDDAWMLRRLAALLAPLEPNVWPSRRETFERAREGDDGLFPNSGVHVWIGTDADLPQWLPRSRPRRTLVLAQSASPSRWLDMLRAIAGDGARPLELVVESHAKAKRFGRDHHVVPPPIDLGEFGAPQRRPPRGETGEFIVGNVVQDGRVIPHAREGSLQERLAATGVAVHLYDPGRIRHALGAMRNVTCISRRDLALAQFLSPLSCYLHCCEGWWQEGLGRDLFGAMALGIPVLCPRTSIYAEYVRDGVDGILYDDNAGALEGIAALRGNPARQASMGDAARDRAAHLFLPSAVTTAWRRLVRPEAADR